MTLSSPAVFHAIHSWSPTPLDGLILNFNCSIYGNSGLAGVGGTIRNGLGCTILSFSGLKLNFDCSAYSNSGSAGVGGIIRNGLGHTALTFSGSAEICLANEAKCLAHWTGLREDHRFICLKVSY